jgi:carbonic anhydrase/acetyltransferase-like protein (isoleucine patch superfamily)
VTGNPGAVTADTAWIDEAARASGPVGLHAGSRNGHKTVEEHDQPPPTRRGSSLSVRQLTRRMIDHLHGEQTLEQLVAEGLQLGERVSVAPRAYLDPDRPWLITIGDESVISDFAIILAHHHGPKPRLGRVVIGRRVFIAPSAIILPGTRIGDDSVIDVRAVVSGQIPPGSFVSGNPGRITGDVATMAAECRQAAADGPAGRDKGSDGYVRASAAQG